MGCTIADSAARKVRGLIGLFALLLAVSAPAVPPPGFSASVVGISARRESVGVRLDWQVEGGAEADPRWVVEACAVGADPNRAWKAVGVETAFGREPNVVRYSALLPTEASVDTLEIRLWAEGLQDRPEAGWIVPVMAAPTAPAALPQRAPLALATATSSEPAERVRLLVSETGRYVVTAAELALHLAPGDEALIRTWIATTNLSITCMGDPVAWHPVDNGAALAFIGRAYCDVYTDRNAYWIEPGPGLAMVESVVTAPPPPQEIGTFWCETRFEPDRDLFETLPAERTLDGWYWDWVDTSTKTNKQTVSLSFTAPDAIVEGSASLRLWARSFYANSSYPTPHGSLTLSLGGSVVGAFPVAGAAPEVLSCTVPQSLLGEANALNVAVARSNGVLRARYAIDSVTLGYERRMTARDGQLLLTLGPGETNVVAGGFSTNAVDVYGLDASGSTVRMTGAAVAPDGAAWQCAYLAPEATGGTMLLTACSHVPDSIEGVPADPWAGDDHEVDYLVVSPAAFRPALEPLLALRAQQFRVGVVTAEDVYRHNNFGRFSPAALRELLGRTRTWRRPPRFVLLVGHGHYDYRSILGTPDWQPNFVAPTLLDIPYEKTASGRLIVGGDNDVADFDGDGIPDILIGRLPARTAAELQRMVAKTLVYESTRALRVNAITLADIPVVSDTFSATALDWASRLPPALARTALSPETVPAGQGVIAYNRAAFQSAINQGVWFSAYFGHANTWFLGNLPYYLAFNEVASLENAHQPGLLLGTTCAINDVFKPSADSLWAGCVGAEPLRGTDGGMAAVIGPSSPSFERPGAVLADALAEAIVRRRRFLGEGVRDAHQALHASDAGSIWLTRTLVLLGDPALDLRAAETVLPWIGTRVRVE